MQHYETILHNTTFCDSIVYKNREIVLTAEIKKKQYVYYHCTGYDPSPNLNQIVANSRTHYLLRKPVDTEVLLEVLRARL